MEMILEFIPIQLSSIRLSFYIRFEGPTVISWEIISPVLVFPPVPSTFYLVAICILSDLNFEYDSATIRDRFV